MDFSVLDCTEIYMFKGPINQQLWVYNIFFSVFQQKKGFRIFFCTAKNSLCMHILFDLFRGASKEISQGHTTPVLWRSKAKARVN